MKLLVIVSAVLACTLALPTSKLILPRLPVSVLTSGKYALIPEDKIVGGTEVPPNSLPFQVSLQRRGLLANSAYSHICGGSILDGSTILDAAHCVDGANLARLRVVVGEHVLSVVDSKNEQISSVSSVKIHEAYSSATYENDIALIFLTTPITLNSVAAPVNLPPVAQSDLSAGTIITVSGWGTTTEGGSLSDTLLSVDIPVIDDSDCNIAYGGNATSVVVYASMMCAGRANGGIDSCQGDSGGPLFVKEGTDFVQHGIVSWGFGCAQAAYPGVYTQVNYFLDWIATNRG